MAERKIDPKFNIYETYKTMNVINPYRFGGGAPPVAPIQAETTAYMTAIGVPNDATATIYGKTGAQVWDLFNSCIMIAKNAGKLGNIYTWYPMFGTTEETLKINAVNVNTFNKLFYGGWGFSENGNQANGSNTYADDGFFPSVSMNLEDNGFTVACNSNQAVGSSSNNITLGAKGGNSGYVVVSIKRFTNEARASVGINTFSATSTVNTASGITSAARISGVLKLWKNNAVINSITASGILPNVPVYYGAYHNVSSPTLYDNQRLLSEVKSTGDDATMSIVHQMIDTWEAGLNRKTW